MGKRTSDLRFRNYYQICKNLLPKQVNFGHALHVKALIITILLLNTCSKKTYELSRGFDFSCSIDYIV